MSSVNTAVTAQAPGTLPKLGYSIKEATKITGLGKSVLWEATRAGELLHFKVGRRVLFSEEHLRDFLRKRERRREKKSEQE